MVEPKCKHAHFNEQELNEYDLTRGQKHIIDEPKTPWEDSDPSLDVEITNEQEEVDIEVEQHLEEARKNKEKNAHLIDKDQAINIGHLMSKL